MATLKQVATESGVSVRTVNRVLKGDGYCAPETRDKVLAASQKLGYVPNLAARMLKVGRSFEICVVGLSSPGTAELDLEKLYAFQELMSKEGYFVNLLFHPEKEIVDAIRVRRPAGVWIMASTPGQVRETLEQLVRENAICHVISGSRTPEAGTIAIDRPRGVYDAVRHLHNTGRRRIACCLSHEDDTRLSGYRRAVRDLGLEEIVAVAPEGYTTLEAGYELATQLMKSDSPPDGIQCHTDLLAMGVLGGLQRLGIHVPRQVGVVGFDNRLVSQYSTPTLTTVAQPNREVGETAARLLLQQIAAPEAPLTHVPPIPTKLIIREST